MTAVRDEKILVTGPAGQIAFPLAARLASDNEVWGIARFGDPKTRERIEEEEFLSNYFTGQGITAPRHMMRQRYGTRIFEAFVQKVYYNLPLPDSLFVAAEE